MTRLPTLACLVTLLCAILGNSQSTTPLPTFEVATVKPSNPVPGVLPRLGCHGVDGISDTGNPGLSDSTIPLGRCVARSIPLKLIIAFAYEIPVMQSPVKISGGASWLDSERFDVEAKAETPKNEAELRLMMRSLLAEQFKLSIHTEAKNMDVLTLMVAGGGSKLTPSKQVEECGPVSLTNPCGYLNGGPPRGLQGVRVPVSALLTPLAIWTRSVVEDGTGLKGFYDISTTGWNVSDDTQSPSYRPNLPDLTTLLGSQLGVTLKRSKKAVDVYVIDHIERPN